MTVPGTDRAIPAADVAAVWRSTGSETQLTTDADQAIRLGLERARTEGGPLIVAGSLYLVGAVRGNLLGSSPAVGA